jgi:hypothetical protein
MAWFEIIPYSSHLLMGELGFEIRSPLRILMSQFDPSAYSSSVQNLTTNYNKTQHFQKSFRHKGANRAQRENTILGMLTRPPSIHTRSRHLPVDKSLLPPHLRRASATRDTRLETPSRTKTHLRSNDSITCISIFLVFVSRCRISSHRPQFGRFGVRVAKFCKIRRSAQADTTTGEFLKCGSPLERRLCRRKRGILKKCHT